MSGAGAKTSRIRFPGKPFCAVPIKNLCSSSPSSRPCRNACNVGSSSGLVQKLTLTRGRFEVRPGVASSEMAYTEVLSGGGSKGKGLQQPGKHALLLRIPRTPYECRGIITATFREESAEGPDGSSHGVLPTATCGSSLWAPQNFTQSRRDGRKDSSARSSTATSPTTTSTTKGR